MSRPRKDRIDITPSQQGLANPFAALEASGLPAGHPARAESRPPSPPPTKLGRVVLRKETARRGGKAVIVIHDFAPHLSFRFIEDLARRLRKSLGCGGAAHERTIEIQGDQAAKIRAFLQEEGFRVVGVQ